MKKQEVDPKKRPHTLFIDGKWQGGTFPTFAAAKAAGDALRVHREQDIQIVEKALMGPVVEKLKKEAAEEEARREADAAKRSK